MPVIAVDYDDDESITAGLRRRDTEVMQVLYDRTSSKTYGLACRMLGESETAEDITEEAYLSLWRAADQNEIPSGSLQAYLLILVHRSATRVLRTCAGPSASRQSPLKRVANPVAIGGTPEVRGAIEGLSADQAQLVDMAYYQGRTLPDIADALGLPLGAVSHGLRIALKKVRTAR
ncbi:MAG: sigma factor [Chloroflexota bacterium]